MTIFSFVSNYLIKNIKVHQFFKLQDFRKLEKQLKIFKQKNDTIKILTPQHFDWRSATEYVLHLLKDISKDKRKKKYLNYLKLIIKCGKNDSHSW